MKMLIANGKIELELSTPEFGLSNIVMAPSTCDRALVIFNRVCDALDLMVMPSGSDGDHSATFTCSVNNDELPRVVLNGNIVGAIDALHNIKAITLDQRESLLKELVIQTMKVFSPLVVSSVLPEIIRQCSRKEHDCGGIVLA